MARKCLLSVFLFLSSVFAHASSGVTVDKDAFQFRLPAGWEILSQDESKDFWTVNYSNSNSDVIQLSVSKKLDSLKFISAKRNLKAGLGRDKSKEGWQLKHSATIQIASFGEVDEELYRATKGDLTSASYTIYGSSNIAIFTFTLNRDAPNITSVVRPLLSGFAWK